MWGGLDAVTADIYTASLDDNSSLHAVLQQNSDDEHEMCHHWWHYTQIKTVGANWEVMMGQIYSTECACSEEQTMTVYRVV